jgi:hypothetical protein
VNIAAKEIQLANGDIIPVGMNFYTLKLMSQYKGGLSKLRKDMEKLETSPKESDDYGDAITIAMDAMSYMLWALIRSGGTQCTVEECSMAISTDDFMEINEIMDEFTEAAKRMTAGKNPSGRMA